MRIIDAHIHVLDHRWIPEGMRRSWARAAAGRRHPERDAEEIFPRVAVKQDDPTAERTIAAFDRAGVDAGVIPIVDWTIVGKPTGEHLPIRDLHRKHEDLAERWPGRLFYCAGIDPRHPDAREIAETALSAPACVGMKLYPAAGWDTDDPEHDWVFELAAEREVPVVIHTSPLGGEPLETPRSRPAALAGAMRRHVPTRFVLAHAGFEAWWLEAIDMASNHWRTSLDLSIWQQIANRDYPEFRRRVGLAVERLGAHRVIFATDIIRGEGFDPEGDELLRYIDQFCGLAEPFAGAPAIVGQDQLELLMAGSAMTAYRLDERRLGGSVASASRA